MKQDRYDSPLDHALDRDGFSPELPQFLAPVRKSLPLSLRLLCWMLRDLRYGRLDIDLPNGERRSLVGSEPGPHGLLQIHDARLVRHVLSGGEVGFGEAYMAGCWDSPDLASLLEVLYLNESRLRGPYEQNLFGRLWGYLQHRARSGHRAHARGNIEHHYDLGNDFFSRWLDPTMCYSSAVFESPEQGLHEAQINKFRLLCARLELKPGHHLLEIGSGWGGLAIHAAREHGCRVTSITLSPAQREEAQRRAQDAGVADRVRFELMDYRDLRGSFDRVVSVEMYEAVGADYWPQYFRTISDALRPGGIAALQGITIDGRLFEQYCGKRDFIQKYIFPGGMLCTPGRLHSLARDAGLVPQDAQFFGGDYARTLALWHRTIMEERDAILRDYGERFLRMWRYYLAYCECGFRVGSIDLMHLTLRKPA